MKAALIFLCLAAALGAYFFFFKPQAPSLTSPSPTTTATITPALSQAPQNNWKLYTPADHTFVPPDKSFSFVYPADWAYETIDGIIPQQQHIVNLGRERTITERQALAQKAGIPLTDTISGINYTDTEITLYYTNTPEFQVTNTEELLTGASSSKKQITVDNVPAIEATVDCPTECHEVVFTKNQATFVFIQAKVFGASAPLDTTKLSKIVSTFKFTN